MNHFHDESVISTRFKEVFEPEYPDLKVDYLGQATEAADSKLVRFRVLRAPTRQVGLRSPTRPMRNYGSIVIQIMFPNGQGPGDLLEVVDFISSIFLGWRSDGILCKPPNLTGPREEGTFLMATVDIPFMSDYHA